MTVDKRLELTEALHKEGTAVLIGKGKAYAGTGDSLANFKRNAERLGLTKYQIWGVYFNKHIDSINNAIQQHPEFPIDETEGLKGRIIDAKNYLDILYCMLYEDEQLKPVPDFMKGETMGEGGLKGVIIKELNNVQ